ncbi:hypothetical protein CALVIDRAFT_397359 [Calocera viscosa TUFC12733]|uniref:Uncharacterized protein n=1 Tax=Calocera viscosa (strain TUFC12733) TaxID=1330018 RepID=A0A167PQM0_CALVF|nr:hypothetical protein CALVIDRAFT_397359 [Calocera viscosa TUFC12733]
MKHGIPSSTSVPTECSGKCLHRSSALGAHLRAISTEMEVVDERIHERGRQQEG